MGAAQTVEQARISAEELAEMARENVPLVGPLAMRVESVLPGAVTIRVPYRDEFVRPGGTISGPLMMAVADFAMYGVVLSLIGRVDLAVTTNLSINFLRRPSPGEVVARARILKLGRRLAVGEVHLHAGEADDLVAHVTSTYSIPPRP
ncbi:MAG: hotdog fold thioesterase [Gammaproteobacteria bacterium]|nr:hotdog fold thioesterase [Gammaproteobacteria bacterium]NIM74597.1 hotdog fold thioesterase [Gammaproteobacteria bacterium]NIO26430.1 hotdog fold thioesterase [Gammaproteobacteria bacterium]NIO66982.1 hotdog fold thioesterase [Gammaproteobacteria bacterium]NIP46820.1 PaaI family thioesterase [Gammaproteobacteria bacterium]